MEGDEIEEIQLISTNYFSSLNLSYMVIKERKSTYRLVRFARWIVSIIVSIISPMLHKFITALNCIPHIGSFAPDK